MKTKFSSYSLNGIPTGCKYCIKGKKLVLFISGKCSRNCYYCSLSEKRKNKDIIWANERVCKSSKEIIEEIIESNANSAGITGGDPLLSFNRTLKFAKSLKSQFGPNFHIHIYLPTKLLTKDKLKKLSGYIDEVRFHPEFLINPNSDINNDIDKIKLASLFWKKQNIGIELPLIPEKKKEILNFITKISHYIGFVNFNELEISDTNFNIMIKKYKFNENGYVINSSKEAGIWILNKLKNQKTKLKIHLCTADLKNNFQFKNRLKNHKIFPFGQKTKDGLVKYLAIYPNTLKELIKIKNKIKGDIFIDKKKNRIILSEYTAKKYLNKYEIFLVEEFPTFDGLETDKEKI